MRGSLTSQFTGALLGRAHLIVRLDARRKRARQALECLPAQPAHAIPASSRVSISRITRARCLHERHGEQGAGPFAEAHLQIEERLES